MLETYAFPHLKRIFVRDITEQDIKRVLEPMWKTKTETATRVRIERVLDWARAEGFRTGDNPARWPGSLEVMLGKPSQDEESMPALPYRELPAFLAELRRQEGIAARALALS